MNQQGSGSEHTEIIERQAREIATLRQRLEQEHFARELSRLLMSAKAINIILAPFTHTQLLEMIVSTAARVIAAQSGSLFLIDEEAGDLVFEVAIGPAAQEAKKFRVPLGHGIAGMVALTGQPLAVADAHVDSRMALDIATSIDYIPHSILCVPLFYADRVIGALELLDKIGASSFGEMDMEVLSLFANIAAIAIAQSQAYHDQQTVLTPLLRSFGELSADYKERLSQDAIAFSSWTQTEIPTNAINRELALLVHEVIQYGEQESELCKHILSGIVANLRSRSENHQFASSRT